MPDHNPEPPSLLRAIVSEQQNRLPTPSRASRSAGACGDRDGNARWMFRQRQDQSPADNLGGGFFDREGAFASFDIRHSPFSAILAAAPSHDRAGSSSPNNSLIPLYSRGKTVCAAQHHGAVSPRSTVHALFARPSTGHRRHRAAPRRRAIRSTRSERTPQTRLNRLTLTRNQTGRSIKIPQHSRRVIRYADCGFTISKACAELPFARQMSDFPVFIASFGAANSAATARSSIASRLIHKADRRPVAVTTRPTHAGSFRLSITTLAAALGANIGFNSAANYQLINFRELKKTNGQELATSVGTFFFQSNRFTTRLQA